MTESTNRDIAWSAVALAAWFALWFYFVALVWPMANLYEAVHAIP
jgi:hypothetical protein